MLSKKSILGSFIAMAMLAGCSSTPAASTDASDASGSDFDSSNDITVISRESGSGTRGAFIELTGVEEKQDDQKVDMTTDDAQVVNSTSVVLTTVETDPYAIGYVSLGTLNDKVKAVKVDGAEATADAIKAGQYKLSRPFNIATKGETSNEVVKDFMAYILSAEGQEIVTDNGYIALDDTKAFEGTQPSGNIVVGGSSSVSPLMEKLIEAYSKVNPNASIDLQTSDSTTGMTSCAEGSYDIGMASRELKQEELDSGLKNTVIATDGIAVIVNKENPTDELSSDAIKSIYTGDTTTWNEVK
jgi:phosphate transport system substrate-binding protein